MGEVEPLELALDTPVNTDPYNNTDTTGNPAAPGW